MSDLRTRLARLAHQNPALRSHLVPLLKAASTIAPLDPSKSIMYFDLTFEDYNVEEDANSGDPLAKQIMEDGGKTANKLEGEALKHLSTLFGERIMNEGHDGRTSLICKFSVNTWEDVKKANDIITRNHIGGDDQIEGGARYYVAQNFVLYPQGVNGPRFGDDAHTKGNLSDWIDDNKPGKKPSKGPGKGRKAL